MAKTLFPSTDKMKLMLMLSAYMDETGHSKDERQRFNGMAGLIASAEDWEHFDNRWRRTLQRREYDIPYFHMKDFANFQGFFEGWSEIRRRKLLGKLMSHIVALKPISIGSILRMEHYRALTESQRKLVGDPYFLGFLNMITYSTSFLEFMGAPPDVRVELVFSDQVEFKYKAQRLYDSIYQIGLFIKRSAYPPDFRPMEEFPALQAADIVAYEMYKEYERQIYRPTSNPRFGYDELVKINARRGFNPMFRFYSKEELFTDMQNAEAELRRKEYWEKRRATKGEE